jgi:outer membrane protein assembly factor BamB
VEALAVSDPRQVGVYRLQARLGAGGMGQVFLGYSPGGRAVAVKVIHHELAGDPEFRARFRREVAAASVVNGAYTAPVIAAGPDDDPPWLATVFVPGPSLAEAVHTAGPLPPASVWRLAGGLVEALQAVHACGLVHRDLKPANVLLALDGPRVIDFGISRALEKTAMTSTGMIVGTPSFMSPEQAEGGRVGSPSDVFSLGCVIVFAATGTSPFGHGPQASLLYRVVHSAPAIAEVPGGLRGLAAGCLAKRPADRPTLAELQAAIVAGRAPDDGDALASFWPVAVTGLIRSHQVRLTTELREAPGPAPAAGDLAGAAGPTAPAAGTTAPAAGTTAPAAGTTAPAAGTTAPAAGTTAPAAGSTALAAGSTVLAAGSTVLAGPTSAGVTEAGKAGLAAGTVTAPAARSGPGLPADQVFGAVPAAIAPGTSGPGTTSPGTTSPGRTGPSRTGSGLTRRRVLLGLAVVTGAGLGGAGWALSQDGAPHHPQAGHHPGLQAKTGRATSRPRATSSSSPSASAAAAGAGRELWSYATGGIVTGLVLAGGTVFAGSTDDKVYALRASDGHFRWHFQTRSAVQSQIAAADGRVYAGSNDASVYALRASDGRPLWTFPAGGAVQSAIVVTGSVVYVASGDETLHALHASDGTSLWSTSLGAGATGIAVTGGTVITSGDDNAIHALRASDGHRLWDFPTGVGGATGLAVSRGVAYAGSGDGKLYAVRAADGRKLWASPAGGAVESGIAVADGVVYLGSNDNMVLALRASTGRPAWQVGTDGPVNSGIAVAQGIVYAGGNDYVVRALRASDGGLVWQFSASGPVASQIAVAGRTAYVGSNDFRVYALQ